jgi:Cation/multidrug efflux pump
MAAHGVCLQDVRTAIAAANGVMPSGDLTVENETFYVEAGKFLTSADDVGNLIVSVHDGKPVYLKNIAEVRDGPR